jgi:hypothetical protein
MLAESRTCKSRWPRVVCDACVVIMRIGRGVLTLRMDDHIIHLRSTERSTSGNKGKGRTLVAHRNENVVMKPGLR